MEENEAYLQQQVDQLRKWGSEIDELKTMLDQAKTDSRSELLKQIYEIRLKTEAARDNLIRIFFSIRNQGHSV